ncbi:upstream stimulatory factor 1 [Sitophilus oryzae]|uniref:Upstream stimulatory factor 1 n=1 Tax=Sitophilus oryzae TaxID=7048 RepID=A0A6J2YQW1_SITOR|nr:upstream stimulatory factor 1 [Sitophilus oryzae]
MDLLDPLERSDDIEIEEQKVILDNMKGAASMDSDCDDDQASIEHLAPQTLLETPDSDVQYSIRSPEGPLITYRVLQVENGSDPSQYVSTTSSFSNSTTIPQVISGSGLNGQIYVIGSPEVYTSTSSTRAIAPRPTVIDNSMLLPVKAKDDKRRAIHNAVERRRRDKINNWIAKLSKIIPEGPQDSSKGNGQYEGHSKGGILAKAFDYIIELQATERRLNTCLKDNKKLTVSIEQLIQRSCALEEENKQMRELLKEHGLEVPAAQPS